MVKVLGVDFSGAETGNATWVCKGVLQGSVLTIESCCRPSTNREKSHESLVKELNELHPGSVAAMDFPFSVPREFARRLKPGAFTMSGVWAGVEEMCRNPGNSQKDLSAFRDLCKRFMLRPRNLGEPKEPKRRGDECHPGCFSPLHENNPDMVPMTFYGMKMLHNLCAPWDDTGFIVPPLDCQGRFGPVLLEVMPGAVLKSLGLPDKGYKGGTDWKELRGRILDGLEAFVRIKIRGLANQRSKCLDSPTNGDDCLDAIVAAVAAALWHTDRSLFRRPETTDKLAKLEGWLYAPWPSSQWPRPSPCNRKKGP